LYIHNRSRTMCTCILGTSVAHNMRYFHDKTSHISIFTQRSLSASPWPWKVHGWCTERVLPSTGAKPSIPHHIPAPPAAKPGRGPAPGTARRHRCPFITKNKKAKNK
jgi:hypothetical protein